MDAILKLADQLGKTIAQSKQAADYRAAREAMNAQPDAMELLKDFTRQFGKITELTQKQQPIEPEDKRKLNDLQSKLAAQETFKAFSAAQVEYTDMMRKVSQTLLHHLQGTEGWSEQSQQRGGPDAPATQ